MKTMAAGKFKAKCLAIMDEVQKTREAVVITKKGKPVARLVPIDLKGDPLASFHFGRGEIMGDVISPAVPLEDYEALK